MASEATAGLEDDFGFAVLTKTVWICSVREASCGVKAVPVREGVGTLLSKGQSLNAR